MHRDPAAASPWKRRAPSRLLGRELHHPLRTGAVHRMIGPRGTVVAGRRRQPVFRQIHDAVGAEQFEQELHRVFLRRMREFIDE